MSGNSKLTNQRVGFYFALPAIILLVVILGFPAIAALLQSFDLLWGARAGPSLANYTELITDSGYHNALSNTGLFVLCTVTIHMALGLGVAMLLNMDVKLKWVFRIAALLPWTVPDVIGGMLWRFMFDTMAGFINAIGLAMHWIDAPVDWLGNPSLAFFTVILAEGWRGYPFIMLILLAGLQSIPGQQYEAAVMDGASRWQSFLNVTLPNLKPMIFVALVLDVIWQARLFGLIYGMTGGGPGASTEVIPLLVYRNYFEFFNTSYAAAMAVTLAVVMVAVAIPYLKTTLRRED
jgi:multiple sugar transport system permease protein